MESDGHVVFQAVTVNVAIRTMANKGSTLPELPSRNPLILQLYSIIDSSTAGDDCNGNANLDQREHPAADQD
jgi:hypothetical protein